MKYTDTQLAVFQNKKIAIIGLGVEGLSTGTFLAKYNAKLTFFDQKEDYAIPGSDLLKARDLGDVVLGKDAFEKVIGFDLVFRSPGIKPDEKFLIEAGEKGAIITSQTKLFLELCPCRVVGVTGTKGKGTTSTMIYEMLQRSEFDTYLGGNIGTPPLNFLDKLTEKSIVVLELSSFQLQDVTKSPHIAVLLMIVPEHLDYHENVEGYIEAKRNILRFQEATDFAVINRDYVASHESDVYTDAKIFQVTSERDSTVQGCFIKDAGVWIRMQDAEWKLIDISEITLLGRHNVENVCAAAMAATLAGASKADIVKVLQTFTGLPHRLELVKEVHGVRYYDDSFSTTPETAMAAIETFSEPEILILGGSNKNSDFAGLGKVLAEAKNIKAIIGIGEEWPRIKEAIRGLPEHVLVLEGATDMTKIVKAAATLARPGDIVLLSPACASFDMFNNYKERGELFKSEVNAL